MAHEHCTAGAATPLRVAALLTSHNRRTQTLACIRSIAHSAPPEVFLHIVLVDDGSTDGTAAAVASEFPEVEIIAGSGDLFWCRGMAIAWEAALAARHDAYLWANDDVALAHDAIARLLACEAAVRQRGLGPAIVVGSTRDRSTGEQSYGGYELASNWHPARFRQVAPDPTAPIAIDTFNGNLVLVPSEVVDRIGVIDAAFSHATGDNDYGLRARAAGIPVVLAPGFHGTCSRNAPRERGIRSVLDRKGLPPRDWFLYTRRHGRDIRWLVAFAAPYLKALGYSAAAPLRKMIGSRSL